MISPPAVLPVVGRQTPRLFAIPDYVSSAGAEAIELARMAGLELDPWQEFILCHSLGERADGTWAAFEVGLNVPRQNGKDAILEARELTGLFLLGERLLIHSAHQFDTSLEHFRRLLFLIENTPDFDRRVRRVSRSHGEEGIELKGGQRIRFRTRTKGGGRGFSGDFLALNEAMELPEPTVGALLPTLSARSNPQVWYAGSPVDQEIHEHGVVFARIRERGIRGGDPALAYFEHSLAADSPAEVTDAQAADPEAWAWANPALGIRISPEHVERERRSMAARTFAVERLGVGDWPDTSADSERVITREAWAACAETDASKRITTVPAFAVDVNPDRTWGAIGVGGFRDDGLPQVAVVEHERGTEWIVDRCLELKGEHGRRARFVVDKRGPAAALIKDMKEAKLQVVEADASDYGHACGSFFDDVAQGRLRYPSPQPELDEALAGARKAPLGDAWKWSRKNSTSADISPLVAVTLARWGASAKRGKTRVVDLAAALAAAEAED
jgi:hypothetical protein